MHAIHVSATDESDFRERLSDVLTEINDDAEGLEVVNIAHAANITDNLYVLYSAIVMYRKVKST